jgi:rRNA maturation endonuclease Nob1
MIEQEQEPHICFECDAEFIVHTPNEPETPVSFCPFCGSEVEETFDEEFDEDSDLEDYQ